MELREMTIVIMHAIITGRVGKMIFVK